MHDLDPQLWQRLATWWQAIKTQATCATLAAVMAFLRGESQGDRGMAVLLDAMMCAMLAWFIRDGLEWAGVSGDMSYLGSVIVGYLGMNFLGGQLRRRIDPTVPDRDNP
ncbi:hypothetical protein AAY84_07420 [Serratia marcescens]|uniref:phage holin, lambda family n=1 Tax=Serratia marcescens TaxID=615 RepID=UPI00062C228E|nr:phage holin, lambda family [Serratia marcescens]KKZ19011.1 hypothetical protein AAY84_07420 [Serratia marcescens]